MLNSFCWDDHYTIAQWLQHRWLQARVPGSSLGGVRQFVLQTSPAAIAVVADLVILLVDALPVTAMPVSVLSGCFSGGLVNCEATLLCVDAAALDHLVPG